jgi:hypothetical protein
MVVAPRVQRVVAAVMVAALACAPALLGACAAECVRGMAHGASPHDVAGGTNVTPGLEPDATAEAGAPTTAGSAHAAHLADRHHAPAAAASVASEPWSPASTIAAVENCCSDAAAGATPARLADRSATILLGAPVDVTPVYAVSVPRGLPEGLALFSAQVPRGTPLVLRI